MALYANWRLGRPVASPDAKDAPTVNVVENSGIQKVFIEPDGHEYRDRIGRIVVGVGEILRDVGIIEYAGIPEHVIQRAANRGIAVHQACEDLDLGRPDWWSDDPELGFRVKAWADFKRDTGFSIELSEHVVYSKRWDYAGTIDRAGMIRLPGGVWVPVVLDIKATWSLNPWTKIQLAGYAEALEGLKYTQVRRLIVHLKPKGGYEVVDCKDEEDRDVFLGALRVSRWRKANL